MARPVVGNPFEGQLPTVSATASPVDVYVRGTEKRSSLAALAKTLEGFSSKATSALAGMEKQAAEREVLEGQRLYAENRIAIGDAVKKGIIEEGASPYIRKGYRISQMSTMAMRYADDLERVLEQRKLYQNGDPERIESFIQKFQNEFIEANGLSGFIPSELQEYFGTSAAKSNEVFRGAWRDKHVAWQKKAARKAFENQVAMATMVLMQEGATYEERQAALKKLGGYVQTLADGKKVDGVSNEDVINSVLQGVGTIAEYTADDSILDLFDNIKFGTNTASSSLKIQDKIIDIQNKVFTLQERRRVQQEREVNQANEAVRATANQTLFAFLENPTEEGRAAIDEEMATLQATGVEKNVDEALQIQSLLDAHDKNLEASNKTPETEIALDYALSQAKTEAAARSVLTTYADNLRIGSNEIFTKLNYWRQNYDPANDEAIGLDFVGNTTEAKYAQSFYTLIYGDPDSYDFIKIINAQQALDDFKDLYRAEVKKWSDANKGAFPDAATKEDIGSNVRRKMVTLYAERKQDSEFGLPTLPQINSLE